MSKSPRAKLLDLGIEIPQGATVSSIDGTTLAFYSGRSDALYYYGDVKLTAPQAVVLRLAGILTPSGCFALDDQLP
jgi:hypothetical protein